MERKEIKYRSNYGKGISDETRQKWDDKINYCIEQQDHLTEWEMEFIDSLSDWRSKERDLTHKQSKTLNRIFEKVNK